MLGELSTAPAIESWQEQELLGRDAGEKVRLARNVETLLVSGLSRTTRKRLAAEWRHLVAELQHAIGEVSREPADIDLGWIPDYLRKQK